MKRLFFDRIMLTKAIRKLSFDRHPVIYLLAFVGDKVNDVNVLNEVTENQLLPVESKFFVSIFCLGFWLRKNFGKCLTFIFSVLNIFNASAKNVAWPHQRCNGVR